MNRARFALLTILLVLVAVTGAQAQSSTSDDYTFKGFYVGVNAGGGFTNGDTSFTPLPDTPTFFSLMPVTLKPDPNGWIAGGQLGYNWQNEPGFVFGVEADIQGTGFDGTATVSPIIASDGSSNAPGTFLMAHHETNWLGTVRPRIGYTGGRWLIYGTGGLAYGHVQWAATTDFTANGPGAPSYPAAQEATKVGWTGGGGVEFEMTPHWIIGAEYLYYDLGDTRLVGQPLPAPTCAGCAVQYDFSSSGHIFRGRLNYRFSQ
jgi:outer membrane immunogenic protein